MILQPHDLHFVFDDTANRITCWNAAHQMIWQNEMRNSTVANGQFGHFGNCPRGFFVLGTPRPKHEPAFGFWFTPVLDAPGSDTMARWGRVGVGIHGGGSGLLHWDVGMQGFVSTHGCLRMQNNANQQLVELVKKAQAAGGVCYFTVAGQAS